MCKSLKIIMRSTIYQNIELRGTEGKKVLGTAAISGRPFIITVDSSRTLQY